MAAVRRARRRPGNAICGACVACVACGIRGGPVDVIFSVGYTDI